MAIVEVDQNELPDEQAISEHDEATEPDSSSLPPLPADEPRIALDELPLEEMTGWFQKIGKDLVEALFYEREPQLLEEFTPQRLDWILAADEGLRPRAILSNSLRGARRLRERIGSFVLRLLRRRSSPYSRALKRAIYSSKPFTEEEWRLRMIEEIGERIGLAGGCRVPDDFWVLLGERAWRDLEFRYDIARLMEESFRARTFFVRSFPNEAAFIAAEERSDFPNFFLAPNTFWILLAMACSTATTWRTKRQIRKAMRRLQEAGEELGLAEDWANVWDQWILLEADRQWHTPKQKSKLIFALRRLPLQWLQRFGDQVELTPNPSDGVMRMEAIHWADEVPEWFRIWLRQQESIKRADVL